MIHEYKSFETNELFSAMSKAQSEITVAVKASSNPFFKSSYANLQSIIEASRPSLCKHGLSVMQQIILRDGQSILVTILGHSSGQWISSEMQICPQKADVQSLGSYITYLRRYSYAALVGVYDGHEDDDGNDAVGNTQPKKELTIQHLARINSLLGDDIIWKEAILVQHNITDLCFLNVDDADKLIEILLKHPKK